MMNDQYRMMKQGIGEMRPFTVGMLMALVFAMGGMTFSAQAEQGQVQDWQRYPYLKVPSMAEAPKIDGVVDNAEWAAASALGPADPEPSRAGRRAGGRGLRALARADRVASGRNGVPAPRAGMAPG